MTGPTRLNRLARLTRLTRLARLNRLARPAVALAVAALTLGISTAGTVSTARSASATGLAVLPAATIAAPAAPAAAGTSGGVLLSLGSVGPAALKPGDDVLITGTVRNGTGRKLTKARVSLSVHGVRLAQRSAVQAWYDGTDDGHTDRVLSSSDQALGNVAGGATATFSLRIPVARFGLVPWSSPGPRGITVNLDRGTRTLASQRSTIVWWPQQSTTATQLALLAPVTPTSPSTDVGAPTTGAEADLAPGGRLDRVVDATQDSVFGWAVDPSLLSEASALRSGATVTGTTVTGTKLTGTTASPTVAGSGPSTGVTPSPSEQQEAAMRAGRQWLTKVGSRLAGRTVVGLPYGDPDLSSVLNNKAGSLLKMMEDLGRRVTQQTVGQGFDTSIVWPGDGRLSTRSVSALAKSGHTAVLLASATQPVENATEGETFSGRSALTGGGQSLKGLLYDEDLSTLVSGSGGTGSVQATQSLLAQLATLTLASPDQPLHLLAVTPRTWSPDPLKVQALTSTLRGAPYVQLATLPELLSQDPVEQRSPPVYKAAAKASELPPAAVQRALALKRKLDVFAPAVANPDAVLDPYRTRVASLLSVSWRRDRTDLAAAGTEIDRRVGELTDGVHLQVGAEGKLFTARSAPIQLAVNNETGYDLKVRVALKPSSGQLTMDSKELVAKANQQTKVLIPTHAIASGDVLVTATLQNPTGGVIEEPSQFSVKVRPNWETRGMIGAASVLGVLLIIGLLRGVRRNRTRVPSADVPDVDELAVQQAAEKGAAQKEADQKEAADKARATQPPSSQPPSSQPPSSQPPVVNRVAAEGRLGARSGYSG